ncbi:MAG: hypothetical protein EBQ51_07745 [Verrucomicrobia bacterium]|nr:hypothetical protein [Pseudomonadota bacterium]NBS05799.1 hypothetical protein [Verrucomicrobiota bacterium]NBS78220.1 hypothetical protein [bacterium]NBS49391.1 hypothetical protein [Verrucomicrobiota bacterium]NBT23302.1 hypothetical protein [bacterium]
MSRRAHQKTPQNLFFGLIAGFFLLAAIGAYVLQKGSNPYRTTEPLKPADYFENANSLRGNVYQVEGVILNALAQNPEKGRLFSISVTSESKKWPMPILIPAKLRQINLQKNQSYRAKCKVDDTGILVAEEIQKS